MENNVIKRGRIAYFDNAKVMLLFLVFLGHTLEIIYGSTAVNIVYKFIYLFHMPAFVLISGYLAKRNNKTKIMALALQYVIFQTLYNLFDIFVLNGKVKFDYTTPYWILWYIFALIVWRVVVEYTGKYSIVVSVVLAILCGYEKSIGYYLSLSRIIVLFPFFLMGYYMNIDNIRLIKKYMKPWAVILIAVVSLAGIMGLNISKYVLFHSYSYSALKITGWYAGGIRLGLLAWGGLLVVGFLRVVPESKTWYTRCGQNTMTAYILHGFIMKAVGMFEIRQYISGAVEYMIYFAVMLIIFALLMSKPVNALFSVVFVKPVNWVAEMILRR